ncbi:MAG: hypothetical protein QM831_21255 [Kofleriaceae bacterium]
MSPRWLMLGAVVVAGVAIALVVMVRHHEAPPRTSPSAPVVLDTPSVAKPIARIAPAPADAARTALATLRASGPGHEVWNDQATKLLESVDALSHTAAECYVAGCAATFTFVDDARYAEAAAKLEQSDAYGAWTGGKTWTAPEHRDGHTLVTLLLYRPD